MRIQALIRGVNLAFATAPSLFSPKAPDQGSLLLLSLVNFNHSDKILDLGCGYGLMGIYAAKQVRPENVYLIDNDPVAVKFAAQNAETNDVTALHLACSDGFHDFREVGFTKILCNPPYHTDFSVAKHFIEKGFNRLALGGALWLVTKRDKWYRNKLTSVFGGVRVSAQNSYFVFNAIKKTGSFAKRMS